MVLELECDPFGETLAGWQGDVFQMSGFEQLPDQATTIFPASRIRKPWNSKYKGNSKKRATGINLLK